MLYMALGGGEEASVQDLGLADMSGGWHRAWQTRCRAPSAIDTLTISRRPSMSSSPPIGAPPCGADGGASGLGQDTSVPLHRHQDYLREIEHGICQRLQIPICPKLHLTDSEASWGEKSAARINDVSRTAFGCMSRHASIIHIDLPYVDMAYIKLSMSQTSI